MRRPSARALVAACAVAAVVVAGCTSSNGTAGAGADGGTPRQGGKVSFALPPKAKPNWILPIGTPGHLATYNSSIQSLLFVPVYAYNGSSGTVALDEKASAAKPPEYSHGAKTVTVTLKDLTWSNGKEVTSRDVEFWFNLIKANKTRWAGYTKGYIPENIEKFSVVDEKTFRLELTHAVNPDWFTANQLSQITPLPQAAWDIKSDGGKVGDYDRTKQGAKKVFDYLIAEARELANYETNPLWKVVNGPFELQSFTSTGKVTVTKNKEYTGDDAAHLSSVTFKPFTSTQAEFNALRAGGIDYGYVPMSSVSMRESIERNGYRVETWDGWSISYLVYNFNNPAMGNVFDQLYIRQAVQHAVNQPAIAKTIWHDQATPTYGPVPQTLPSKYLSDAEKNNPYPYNLKKAQALLTSHGWTIGSDNVASCTAPGTGDQQCGKGIKAGTRLHLELLAESGSVATNNMVQALQSSLSKIGIKLSIKSEPLNAVLNQTVPCTSSEPSCDWQMSFFGTQGSWYFPAFPSGEFIFATGGGSNLGNYSDPKADELIQKTTTSSGAGAMRDYSAYLAKQLPVVWLPNPPYQVSAIKKDLRGVVQDPMAGMQPQRWYLVK